MFKGRFSKDGKGFVFSDFYKKKLVWYMRHNPNQPFELKPILIESKKQRGWFEGGICPLFAFYQNGLDHHESADVRKVREWLKVEFNSEIVALGGIAHKVPKSTKNELNSGFLERVVDYMVENYAPPQEALDPKKYKHWHDSVFPYGGPDNYIDYLLELKIIKSMEEDEMKKSAAMEAGLPEEEAENMVDDDRQPNYSADEENE